MAIPAMPLNGAGVPDLVPWATGAAPADVVEPTVGEKAAGWATNQLPPHEYFNWYQKAYGAWVARIRTSALFYDSATGVVYNAYKTDAGADVHATADYVLGSFQLDTTALAAHAARVGFDKSKSAFRAGYALTNRWDDANRGSYSAAFGYESKASGDYSFAAGDSSTASGSHATAMCGGQATGGYATALGLATASGLRSLAAGDGTCVASGIDSVAIGESSSATATNALAMQGGAAQAQDALAIGNGAQAQVTQSVAIGEVAKATGQSGTAVGTLSEAAESATSIGRSTTATGLRSTAVGFAATANADDATAVGRLSEASAVYAAAFGYAAQAQAGKATALGAEAHATMAGSFAGGAQAIASGAYATALGGGDNAGVHAAEAAADDSVALGRGASTTAGGTGGAAVGKNSAIGALGVNGFAASGGTANGTNATAVGRGTASGQESMARGTGVSATQRGASAWGRGGTGTDVIEASGEGSEACGTTEASGKTLDAVKATAIGTRAHGKGLTADAAYAAAHGYMAYARLRGYRAQSGAPLGGATTVLTTKQGEAQTGVLDAKVISRSDTGEVLDPEGLTTATETLNLRDDYAGRIEGGFVAYSDGGVVESGNILLVAKQAGGGGGALTLPVNTIAFDTANPNAWTVVATVVGTNGIAITVTGHAAAGNINWECWLRLTETRKADV